jgi:hypothetical protein
MTRIRTLLLTLFVLMSLGALASASASAAACVTKVGAQCLNFLGVLTETEEMKFEGANADLLVEGIGVILCAKATGLFIADETETGVLILKLVLVFSECKLDEHAACVVKEPIETKPISGTLAISGTTGTATFKPEAGEEFATVTITGCEQEAIIKVTGTQGAALPTITTEAVEHATEALAAESKLKDGAKLADFEVIGKIRAEGPKLGDDFAIEPNEF